MAPMNRTMNGDVGANVIKARLGNDVRKWPLLNQELTMNELDLMMQRIFKGKIGGNDTLTYKYRDEDGDMITLSDDSDISFALRSQQTLNLTVCVNDAHTDDSEIKKELASLRDRITYLIDTYESRQQSVQAQRTLSNGPASEVAPPVQPKAPSMPPEEQQAVAREFDPYHSQKSVAEPNAEEAAPPVHGMGAPPVTATPQSVPSNAPTTDDYSAPQQPPAEIQPSQQQFVPSTIAPMSEHQTPVSQYNQSIPPTPVMPSNAAPTPPSTMAPPPQMPPASNCCFQPPPPQPTVTSAAPPMVLPAQVPPSTQAFQPPPPVSMQQQPQYNYPPAQQQFAPMPPVQQPPTGGDMVPPPPRMNAPPPMAPGGGNPFARSGPMGGNPYIRPQFGQMPPQ